MDVVGVMAAYLPVVRVCTAQSTEAVPMECQVGVTYLTFHTQYLSRLCSSHTHSHDTDYVHVNGHDRTITVILAKHYIKLPDDGPLVIRNILQQF